MNILKDKREQLGYTRIEMGKLMKCTEDNIYYWETNRRFPKTINLIDIQNHYQMSDEELILYLKQIWEYANQNVEKIKKKIKSSVE